MNDDIFNQMVKKYGENSIMLGQEIKEVAPHRVPTGSLFLDRSLGTNEWHEYGLPCGFVTELYGPQMSGKTSLALKTIAEVQKRGGKAAFFDVEKSFIVNRATELGVDVAKLFVSREGVGERVLQMTCELVKGGVDIVVIDSVASMVPIAELEKDLEDSNRMALSAQMMSQGMRKLTNSMTSKAIVIFINQLREKPGTVYGNPEYTPGGKALGYYAGVRIELRKSEPLFSATNKKKVVGQITKFKVTKNKTDMPNKDGSFRFMYSGEIDQVDELLSIGLIEGLIKQKGAYFYVGEEAFKGREDIEAKLRQDTKLFEGLKGQLYGGQQ